MEAPPGRGQRSHAPPRPLSGRENLRDGGEERPPQRHWSPGRAPPSCQKRLNRAIEATAQNTRLTLTLALSYSGRAEIVDAVRSLVAEAAAGRLDPAEVTPELLSAHLYTHDLPDPDLLIRTSGELRLSNFLLWQLSYTEIHVTPKLWPDFTKADLLAAISDYNQRHRRYGAI